VRLVACADCHAQYDVTDVLDAEIACRCGSTIENRIHTGIDALVHRCGSCGAQVSAEAEGCDYCGSEIVRDEKRLSLICPECYGRNAEESRFCTVCGVPFRPEPVESEGKELPCPCCSCLMPPRSVGGIGINECPQCNGIWVPEKRFDQLVAKACEAAQAGGPAQAVAKDARMAGGNPYSKRVVYRNCPVCDGHMQRTNFQKRSGVILDRCHTHGTWLDADELEQVAGFILEGGMGQGGAQAYVMKTELDAIRRREAAALARAVKGESMTIESPRPQSAADSLFGLIKDLLR
jgi:Zn-finger nucleic acid-binding protein